MKFHPVVLLAHERALTLLRLFYGEPEGSLWSDRYSVLAYFFANTLEALSELQNLLIKDYVVGEPDHFSGIKRLKIAEVHWSDAARERIRYTINKYGKSSDTNESHAFGYLRTEIDAVVIDVMQTGQPQGPGDPYKFVMYFRRSDEVRTLHFSMSPRITGTEVNYVIDAGYADGVVKDRVFVHHPRCPGLLDVDLDKFGPFYL